MPGYLGGYTFNDYVNVTSNTEIAVSYAIHDCSESFSTTYIYKLINGRWKINELHIFDHPLYVQSMMESTQ